MVIFKPKSKTNEKTSIIADFFQIINVKDPNWWQAKHIGQNEVTGLIPSQELEERRKAFVPPEADFVHTISICGTKVCIFNNSLYLQWQSQISTFKKYESIRDATSLVIVN